MDTSSILKSIDLINYSLKYALTLSWQERFRFSKNLTKYFNYFGFGVIFVELGGGVGDALI